MSTEEPVSEWIRNIGNDVALQKLWERYFRRLVGLARKKLRASSRTTLDEEEDIALSAFDSFCKGARQGRYPRLDDRNNLWNLLAVITARKACDAIKREQRQKRGGGALSQEAKIASFELEQIIDKVPTPAFAAEVADRVQRLLGMLDETLRRIALWKLEGHSNAEIAALLGCVETTVERRLRVIRSLWGNQE